jgi:hypothetical protein
MKFFLAVFNHVISFTHISIFKFSSQWVQPEFQTSGNIFALKSSSIAMPHYDLSDTH